MFNTSLISSLFGKFASTKFPALLQYAINKSYVGLMHVDLSDFLKASEYKSLNDLFTRSLIKPRNFDKSQDNFISPCDGFITECGRVEQGIALQIKGFSYKISELLSDKIDDELKFKLEGGEYINFYLSPKDYHRYHAPIDMKVNKAIHIPGKLYPVNFTWLKKIPNLFIENERVVLECLSGDGKLFYMVFVGALNVGKMDFVFDERIKTNSQKDNMTLYEYKDLFLNKGEELGKFEMGSTIVMLFEKDFVALKCQLNTSVKFGDLIALKLKTQNSKLKT